MARRILAKNAEVGQFVKVVGVTRDFTSYYGPRTGSAGDVGMISMDYSHGGDASLLPLGSPRGTYKIFHSTSEMELLEGEELEKVQESFSKVVAEPYRSGICMGSDPEVFVLDQEGVVIPAWMYLPSKKKGCTYMPAGYEECVAFWDGFQAEFTTHAPTCHAQLISAWQRALKTILREARQYNPKATLTHKCVVEIPFDMMQGVSDEHGALGCAPSFNAYTEESPLAGLDGRMLPFRFAGCHIHFGNSGRPVSLEGWKSVVKSLDAICGVMMVHLLEGLEDPRRRRFYGLAGEFRTPKHGLEWRTPSSAVLAHPIIANWVLDLARVAYFMGFSGPMKYWEASEEEVRDTINSLDVERAREILKRNAPMLAKIVGAAYPAGGIQEKGASLLLKAPAKELLPIGNMEEAWRFDMQEIYGATLGEDCFLAKWTKAGF